MALADAVARRTPRRIRLGLAAAALGGAALAGPSCIAKTDLVPSAFNAGVLDSEGDPFRDPDERRADIVERIVGQELIDGYFGQGERSAAEHSVAAWLRAASDHPDQFLELAVCSAAPSDPRCGITADDPRGAQRQLEEKIRALSEHAAGGEPPPICDGPDQPSWPGLERTLDEIRFHQSIARAARAAGEVLAERLVDAPAVERGSRRAFREAARYLAARRWRRDRELPTTGLVVKGGAATGIFSAGVVWTTLHLLHGCMSDEACRRGRDLRLPLLSGTSTGAMIAVAVDRFNSATTAAERERGIADVARWFTCFGISDLYCVRSAPLTDLFLTDDEAVKGVLEFDGIEKVLTSCVNPGMVRNRSELILNTVDFRTGQLFALSDQAELTTPSAVVQAGLASALLPVIGRPVVNLPVGRRYDPTRADATEPTYLDGGIRSELPVLPLARRGAERVLVVSSSASVLGETKRLKNALKIATRYIDVSSGGIAESELAHARRHAESVRASEIEACYDWLKDKARGICPGGACDFRRICETREWDRACSRRPRPQAEAPAAASASPEAPAAASASPEARAAASASPEARAAGSAPGEPPRQGALPLSSYIAPHWQMMGIFRDEAAIAALKGYDFDPIELRRLFRAGAEEARLRCPDLARLFGVAPEHGPLGRDLEAKIARWCSPELPRHAAVCAGIDREDLGMRTCDEAPPAYLDACGPPPAASSPTRGAP